MTRYSNKGTAHIKQVVQLSYPDLPVCPPRRTHIISSHRPALLQPLAGDDDRWGYFRRHRQHTRQTMMEGDGRSAAVRQPCVSSGRLTTHWPAAGGTGRP